MGLARQKPIQRTVRTAHLSVLMTVQGRIQGGSLGADEPPSETKKFLKVLL